MDRRRNHSREAGRTARPAPRPAVEPEGRGHELLDLQAQAGNQTTLAALRAQAALAVGPADDPFEREADAVAQAVVERTQRSALLRTPSPTDDADWPVPRRADPAGVIGAEGGDLDAGTEARISRARGGGRALDEPVRSRFESALGADLSGVRVHTGSESAVLNRQLGAKAFTIGSDIFFGGSAPDTSTDEGTHLLAHELTHTVQQGGSPTKD